MPLIHWDAVEETLMSNSARARAVRAGNAMAVRIAASAGTSVPAHAHPFDQITHLIRGKLRFRVGNGDYQVAAAGDVLCVPADTPHEGQVIEDAEYIDFFSAPNPMFLQET